MLHFTVNTRGFCGIVQKGNKIAAERQRKLKNFFKLESC